MYQIFSIHSSVEGHLGWDELLAIVKRAEINMALHVSLQWGESWDYMPRSGMAGSEGKFIPSLQSVLHIAFHSDYMILHSLQQWVSVPLSPQPLQHLVFVFLILASLIGVR